MLKTDPARMQAIPTEFMGQRFRSKSEAIFARLLSLRRWMWEYEPDWFPLADFVFSFTGSRGKKRKLVNMLVEYKPATPTDAYLDNKSAGLHTNELLKAGGQFIGFLLVVGSAYGDQPSILWTWHGGRLIKLDNSYFTKQDFERAADFRFDLAEICYDCGGPLDDAAARYEKHQWICTKCSDRINLEGAP